MFPYILLGVSLWLIAKRAVEKANAQEHKSDACYETSNRLKNETNSPALVIQQVEIPESSNRTERGQEQGRKWPQPMTIFTALIFVATSAYAIVSYYQWQMMRETLRTSQRAYVVITDVQFDFDSKRMQIAMENVGHVPAQEIGLHVIAERVMDYKIYRVGYFSGGGESDSMLPGSFKNVTSIVLEHLTPEQSELIRQGKERLRIGCFLSYDNGFGTREEHIFNFSYIPPPFEKWQSMYILGDKEQDARDEGKRFESVEESPVPSIVSPSPTPAKSKPQER